MSDKIKARQQNLPKRRNLIVRDMILRGGGTPMRDRRERRPNEKRWQKDWEA